MPARVPGSAAGVAAGLDEGPRDVVVLLRVSGAGAPVHGRRLPDVVQAGLDREDARVPPGQGSPKVRSVWAPLPSALVAWHALLKTNMNGVGAPIERFGGMACLLEEGKQKPPGIRID